MTKFIFALETNAPEEIELLGAPAFSVVVSTEHYFQTNDCVQDDYEPDDYAELIDVMTRHNLSELSESTFEPGDENSSRTDVTSKLQNEPQFRFSQSFQDFIDDNPEKD